VSSLPPVWYEKEQMEFDKEKTNEGDKWNFRFPKSR
jgi:hypothetical protein